MRKSFGSNVRFMLMNSFSTSEDSLEFLKKYPEISNDPNLELVQVFLYTMAHGWVTQNESAHRCKSKGARVVDGGGRGWWFPTVVWNYFLFLIHAHLTPLESSRNPFQSPSPRVFRMKRRNNYNSGRCHFFFSKNPPCSFSHSPFHHTFPLCVVGAEQSAQGRCGHDGARGVAGQPRQRVVPPWPR